MSKHIKITWDGKCPANGKSCSVGMACFSWGACRTYGGKIDTSIVQEHVRSIDEEKDPNGMAAHEPGAKLDAGKPRVALIIRDMPRALLAVAEVATLGAQKYSEGGWLLVENGLSRYADAQDRHRLKEGIEATDADTGLLHAAHGAWNALARLELMLRERDGDAK